MKFRKKTIIVEAEQWFKVTYDREAGHGFGQEDMPIYHLNVGYYRDPEVSGQTKCKYCSDIMHNHGWINTLEGGHIVCPKDWIVNGIPFKPDIFEKTYEKVEVPKMEQE